VCQKRPIIEAKETYDMRHQVSGRFGETSIVCQKRPIIEAKETYDMRHQVSGRFGETSIVCQKRPIIEAKETYDMRHQVSAYREKWQTRGGSLPDARWRWSLDRPPFSWGKKEKKSRLRARWSL